MGTPTEAAVAGPSCFHWRGWTCGVAGLLMVGCGPTVATPAQSGGTSQETTGAVTQPGTTGEPPTSSSSGGVDTSSSSSGAATTDVSSSTRGSQGELIELQGPIHYCEDCFNPMSYLRGCDSEEDWLCLVGNDDDVWRCNGAYTHVRGYYIPNPSAGALDAPCGEHLFEVTEVLEARMCEPTDCGVGCSEGFDCQTTCYGPKWCARDEKCVPWLLPGHPYDGARHCVPVVGESAAPGEACALDSSAPSRDNCDVTSICVDGACRAMCGFLAEDVTCGADQCFINTPGLSVCMPGCDPVEPNCEEGEVCTHGSWSFACFDEDFVPLLDLEDCPGGACGPLEICSPAEVLLGCSESACCTDLCHLGTPDCAPGLECSDRWDDDEFPALANVGVCVLP